MTHSRVETDVSLLKQLRGVLILSGATFAPVLALGLLSELFARIA